MISSMTGFGKGEVLYRGKRFIVEMKSLNNRYCEVFVNAPKDYLEIEHELIRSVKQRFSRGKFDVHLKIEHDKTQSAWLDEDAFYEKWNALEKLRKKIKHPTPVSIEAVLPFLKTHTNEHVDRKKVVACFLESAEQAFNMMESSRQKEGKELVKILRQRLAAIQKALQAIKVAIPASQAAKTDRLWKKLEKVIEEKNLDRRRVETEIAMLLEKGDISEEVERFSIHVARFKQMTEQKGAIGREMDFLIQEMNREINTVGSKANDHALSQEVILVKSELEKIREQVQNLE